MSKNELNHEHYWYPCFMPQGGQIIPVPEVLTEEEAIQFLRLDQDGPKNPQNTLQYYREQGFLHACQIGKRLRYTKTELLRFLEIMTERTNIKAS